jgi:hypothetical protein
MGLLKNPQIDFKGIFSRFKRLLAFCGGVLSKKDLVTTSDEWPDLVDKHPKKPDKPTRL